MIEVEIRETDKGLLSLTVKGHAGASEVGKDIVCASASILTYTVAQYVKDMGKMDKLNSKPTIILKKGNAKVTCSPKDVYYDECRQAYLVVATGFNLLAKHYPQYVTFKLIGGKA